MEPQDSLSGCRLVSVAALVISILSLVVSTTFAFLGWNLNRRALDMKAPKVVASIGRSAQSLRMFEPIVKEARIDRDGMRAPLGLKVRNDGERPVHVTSIICWTASPGTTPPTKHGAWPSRGPDLPHEISTGDAVWEIPMEQVAHLDGYRRWGEDTPVNVSFELGLSTGEKREVGPVLLHFPPEQP
jgi:hypothetical protein